VSSLTLAKRLCRTGSIRSECIDHIMVFGERHLRHVLLSYMTYYNTHPFVIEQGRAEITRHRDSRTHSLSSDPGPDCIINIPGFDLR
jgi:hypothetical protein